ncbi:hypothetical protein HMPREF0649_00848 [Segatella buccae D17]|nr:hypothetical protein HMPREF0649_00848 [Segatella buccae D17]
MNKCSCKQLVYSFTRQLVNSKDIRKNEKTAIDLTARSVAALRHLGQEEG